MAKETRYIEFSIAVPPALKHKLDNLAASQGSTRADVIRVGLDYFVSNYTNLPQAQENALERRLQKMESRLAGLTALAARATAQSLYYATLPYVVGGLPKQPLSPDAFDMEWHKSRKFAGSFLKNAEIEIVPKDEPEKLSA